MPEILELKVEIMAQIEEIAGKDACTSLFEEFKRDEYAPPPLMKRMVASGRLGRKSGQGFYDYDG